MNVLRLSRRSVTRNVLMLELMPHSKICCPCRKLRQTLGGLPTTLRRLYRALTAAFPNLGKRWLRREECPQAPASRCNCIQLFALLYNSSSISMLAGMEQHIRTPSSPSRHPSIVPFNSLTSHVPQAPDRQPKSGFNPDFSAS